MGLLTAKYLRDCSTQSLII